MRLKKDWVLTDLQVSNNTYTERNASGDPLWFATGAIRLTAEFSVNEKDLQELIRLLHRIAEKPKRPKKIRYI